MSKLCPQCQRQRSRRTNASRKTAKRKYAATQIAENLIEFLKHELGDPDDPAYDPERLVHEEVDAKIEQMTLDELHNYLKRTELHDEGVRRAKDAMAFESKDTYEGILKTIAFFALEWEVRGVLSMEGYFSVAEF